jgi:SAM-dependent methyltransferase
VADLAGSFGSAADAYERGRPRYEPHVIAAVGEAAIGPRIVDVGAGTGRLSAPLTHAGYDVVAVEPLGEMRAILAAHVGSDRTLDGRAEALPLDDGSVGGAVCSDAWHWFDGARAADELARVVAPGGGVVICVSLPTWRADPEVAPDDDAPHWFLDLGVVHAALHKGDHPYLTGSKRPDGLESHPDFEDLEVRNVPFVHHTDREGIVAHWASLSLVATLPDPQRAKFLEELDAMLARRGVEEVDIPYRAELWITRRRPARALPADRAAAAS